MKQSVDTLSSLLTAFLLVTITTLLLASSSQAMQQIELGSGSERHYSPSAPTIRPYIEGKGKQARISNKQQAKKKLTAKQKKNKHKRKNAKRGYK